VSAKDISMNVKYSLMLSFEMSHPNSKKKFIVPLSDPLTSKESSLSFCPIGFLLIIMICKTKGEQRDSILGP
jgi:hypothetical protein